MASQIDILSIADFTHGTRHSTGLDFLGKTQMVLFWIVLTRMLLCAHVSNRHDRLIYIPGRIYKEYCSFIEQNQ